MDDEDPDENDDEEDEKDGNAEEDDDGPPCPERSSGLLGHASAEAVSRRGGREIVKQELKQ